MLSMSLATATASRIMAVLKSFLKDNLKIYFDFKSSRAKTLEFVGTGSAEFNAVSDKIVTTFNPATELTNGDTSFSIMFWIYGYRSGSSHAYIIGDDTTSPGRFYVRLLDDDDDFTFGASGGYITSSAAGWKANDWNHVTCVYDSGANLGYIYLDGAQVKSGAMNSSSAYPNHNIEFLDDTGSNSIIGKMKNVGIWKRPLSASEVQNIMYKTYSDLTGTELTYLIRWWSLETNSNETIESESSTDTSISYNTDNYGNNAPKKPRGFDNAPTAQADLIGSGSAYFVTTGESTEDYINCGDGAHTGEGKDTFTCTAWIKFDDAKADTFARIIGKGHDDCWQFHIQESDRSLEVYINNVLAESGHTLTQNKWHHVAFTYTSASNGTVKFYVDGVLVHTDDTVSGSTIGTNDHNLIIGADESLTSQGFGGNIAQVGLWERVLTQEDIQSVKEKTYSELTTAEKVSILCYYGLDTEVGSDGNAGSGYVKDFVGSNHGSLN
jgi:hypothetical protein